MKELGIGNTPMIEIDGTFKGQAYKVYAKLEMYSLTGSIKDRVAYYMLEEGRKKGLLKEGTPIVEVTSGNTGISLSALGAYYGYPVDIFMPSWASEERKQIMQSYNAHLHLVSKEEGGFAECFKRAKAFSLAHQAYYPDQFANNANYLAHYETTGKEILAQVPEEIGGFVSGVGTGGTLMGISARLKTKYPNLKVGVLEPYMMPLISKGKILGPHKIEGIGDDFIPPLFQKEAVDEIFLIKDEDAIKVSQMLAQKGFGVGISSGANLLASVLLATKILKPVVTVFPDDLEKYLSTDLVKEAKNISDDVKELQITSIKFL